MNQSMGDESGTEPNAWNMPYYLGCPVWACSDWLGSVFRRGARRHDWLRQYSQAFNTVEGNSSFYGIPTTETAHRWAEETEPGFRFALKFPQVISHERRLENCDIELRAFLHALEVLAAADRLGPTFLQLPSRFGPEGIDVLAGFLARLPSEFSYAVEVRHAKFFASGPEESRLDTLLADRVVDRVLFDSRAIYNGPPGDAHEEESQRRKPRVPFRQTVTGRHPFVRFIGRNDVESARAELTEWAPVVANWLKQGLQPYFFTHAPADQFAPTLASMFHQALMREIPSLPALPRWPGEQEAAEPRQQELF